jgi:hypothetical protein
MSRAQKHNKKGLPWIGVKEERKIVTFNKNGREIKQA